ncbi:MAG: hypothetical protein RLZZ618_2137 [Pseudomonadota bacterium]|jgi:hypothetical protein
MSLPDLAWQMIYARLAWTLVLAATAVGLWSWWRVPSRGVVAAAFGLSAVAVWLPGPASVAHWLGLAFQMPSGLLTACCVLTLGAGWLRQASFKALPLPFAMVLVVVGLVLYLDSSGWLSLGLYASAFGPRGAPWAGVLLGLLAAGVFAGRRHRATAAAVLFSTTLFALTRLPTGNLCDALLDPLLWFWAIASSIVQVRVRRRERRLSIPAVPAAAAP